MSVSRFSPVCWPGAKCWSPLFTMLAGATVVAIMTVCPTLAQESSSSGEAQANSRPTTAGREGVSTGAKETLIGYDELLTLTGHTEWVSGVAFSPDGKQLASVAWDKTVRLWDAMTGKELLVLPPMKNALSSVVFGPDGSQVAVVGFDYTVSLVNVKTGRVQVTLDGRIGEPVTFSSDGKQLMAVCADKERKECAVTVWDTTNGKKMRVLQGHNSANEFCYQVIYSPDRTRHAVTIMNANNTEREEGIRMMIMENRTDGEDPQKLVSLDGEWLPLAFNPDGTGLAILTAENSVKLLPIKDGQPMRALAAPSVDVTSAAFSPDGKWLATVQDTTIRLWNTESGAEQLTLKGHTHSVSGVAFSRDGNRLATSSYDNTIRIWQLRFVP